MAVTPKSIAAFGLRRFAGGVRAGSPGSAALGVAALLLALGRRRRRPDRELIYSRRLRDGESLRITMKRGPDAAAMEIESDETVG
jgi:MYXO-CTERM domain-containing protein